MKHTVAAFFVAALLLTLLDLSPYSGSFTAKYALPIACVASLAMAFVSRKNRPSDQIFIYPAAAVLALTACRVEHYQLLGDGQTALFLICVAHIIGVLGVGIFRWRSAKAAAVAGKHPPSRKNLYETDRA